MHVGCQVRNPINMRTGRTYQLNLWLAGKNKTNLKRNSTKNIAV